MAQLERRGLSAPQRRELWRRWKEGQSLSEIGRALQRQPGSIYTVLKSNGGYVPAERRRSARALSLEEREEISRGIAAGKSLRAIAAQIGRAPSTVAREITRNGGARHYRAGKADDRAWRRAQRPKKCLLAENNRLRRAVATKLAQDWSPEQIAGWLVVEFPDDESMRVSDETIYKSLFIQARGVLKQELVTHLRSRRAMHRAKSSSTAEQGRGQISDAVSIRERPAEVEDRAVPGHWEGDLLAGSSNTHIATLVERQSRFLLLVKVDGKDTETVVRALSRQVRTLPRQLRSSVTWDRGMELAAHKDFTVATGFKVYFCDPQSPWQRGSNENTNGLLRQYFPKGTNVSVYSQQELNAIAERLNTRPRKTLGFRTPAAMFAGAVASTA
jgi:IS30 family transposase